MYQFQALDHPISPCFRSEIYTNAALRVSRAAILEQMTPEGLELNPHGFSVGACSYILPGLVLAGLTIKSPRV